MPRASRRPSTRSTPTSRYTRFWTLRIPQSLKMRTGAFSPRRTRWISATRKGEPCGRRTPTPFSI